MFNSPYILLRLDRGQSQMFGSVLVSSPYNTLKSWSNSVFHKGEWGPSPSPKPPFVFYGLFVFHEGLFFVVDDASLVNFTVARVEGHKMTTK